MIAIYSKNLVTPLEQGYGYRKFGGYVIVEGDNIVDVLPELPRDFSGKVYNFGEKIVMPAIVEPHTHSIFAGDRAEEFHMRMRGKSYVEIAKAGWGILSTVKSTRSTSDEVLENLLRKRLDIFLRNGVLTLEIKSGYDLTHEGEIRLLTIIRRVGNNHVIDVLSTYLGAHAISPDSNREVYVEEIIRKTLPEIKKQGLADFVDVFCDETAYTIDEALKILRRAVELGIKIKVHAEELKYTGISSKVALIGGISADHLIKIKKEDLLIMKERGTVPVLLPMTAFFLNEELSNTLKHIYSLGISFALSTDFNPGSSPVISVWNMVDIAITRFRIPLEHIIPAVTINAAKALALGDRGIIQKGKKAYLVVLSIGKLELLGYLWGVSPVWKVFKGEEVVFEADDIPIWI